MNQFDWDGAIERAEEWLSDLKRGEKIAQHYRRIPPLIRDYLEFGCGHRYEDDRITYCAKWLAVCGFGDKDILDLLFKSPVSESYRESGGEKELAHLVRLGISYWKQMP